MSIFICGCFKKATDYCYLLFKSDDRRLKKIGTAFFFCFLLYAASWQVSYSQVRTANLSNEQIQPLSIGDKIPEALWNMPLQVVNDPEDKTTTTLADYRGKLIILDFWATYCTPCIRNFSKIHALENEFENKMKVLAATDQGADAINDFFKSSVGKKYTYVNSVIHDTILSKYFPHFSIPHIVWIAPDGRLLNTTSTEPVTSANIQLILDGHKAQMVSKIDIDRERPLFLSKNFTGDVQLKYYSIFFKGHYPGLLSGNAFRKTKDGKVYGRKITNSPIMDIYRPVIRELFKKNGESFSLKRAIIEVKDTVVLNLIPKPDSTFETFNEYSYEVIVPKSKADSLYEYMLEGLNRYSDYIGRVEKRMENCFVLRRTSVEDRIETKGGKPKFNYSTTHSILTNTSIGKLVNLLNSDTIAKLPIIDETGYTGNVDMEISGVKNLLTLKRELNRYGLDLVRARRRLNMFVLKDK